MTDLSPNESATFEALLDYLKRTRGFDFTAYKRPTLYRRIEKRVQDLKIKSFTEYLDYLEVHSEEFPLLFDTILINVTSFFRDPQAWTYLNDDVLPELLASKDANDPIRVWSAACASGEEVYTLAMVLAEKLGPKAFKDRVKIYATDVDEDALAQARAANYTAKDLQAVPEDLRKKYFERAGQGFVFSPDLRRSVIFGRHDLLEDAPISRLDLLVCRNALMYFNVETQGRILARFHFALNENGYLFLGKVEMLLTQGNLFLPTNLKARVFTKVPRRGLRDRLMLMAQAGTTEEYEGLLSSQARLRDSAFEYALLPSIVVDSEGTVAQANDQARILFHLTARDIGRPLQDLELSYRPVELRSHIDHAYRQREAETIPVVEWYRGPETVYLEVRIHPLFADDGTRLGVVITFRDETNFRRLNAEFERQKQELDTAYEELQSTNEELETTNEELQSTVEELETTNEELQASNEELETLNEELQSTNEELQSMNDTLRARSTELMDSNTFLNSILGNVGLGVAVLDRNGSIEVWNTTAADMWGVREDEVFGRKFEEIDIGLPATPVAKMIASSLSGVPNGQPQVFDARDRRGRELRCKVTCTPLGSDGSIIGVVVLMQRADAA